jgi:hypothetical protein
MPRASSLHIPLSPYLLAHAQGQQPRHGTQPAPQLPYGHYIVSGGYEGHVRVWHAGSGVCVHVLKASASYLNTCLVRLA